MAAFFTTFITIFCLLQISATIHSARVGILAPKRHGFSLDLVHRDSPSSPLYDSSFTLTERAVRAARQSIWRSIQFASKFSRGVSTQVYSPIKPASGEYLMKLALGTPARLYWAIADTGSDLIWAQCRPCNSCTGGEDSMFDPHNSSTYKTQGCSTSFCDDLPAEGRYCNSDRLCGFHYVYGDQSYADGVLSMETFTFDTVVNGSIKFPSITFGCAHDEGGNFGTSQVSGLIGLGGGPLSLISQISSAIDDRFAYCLPYYDANSTGQLKFGDGAEFSGEGKVQQTEMARGSDQGTFYVLMLNDISVGGEKLNVKFDSARPSAAGNAKSIIIDSGTTLTLLNPDAYEPLQSAVASVVKKYDQVDPVDGFNLCYHVRSSGVQDLPSLTFHFSGADWELPPENGFVMAAEGIACMAIVPTTVGIAIFGNVAQQNFHVEYDLGKGVLSFASINCSES